MQTTRTKNPNRKEHLWYYRLAHDNYKCVLCGGVSRDPGTMEVNDALPERFEKLTDKERAMAPFLGARL